MGEPEVIKAKLVQQGGMEIVQIDGILDNAPADLIGLAIGETTFESAARSEHGEGKGVVIAACGIGIAPAILAERGAAKLATKDNHGALQ